MCSLSWPVADVPIVQNVVRLPLFTEFDVKSPAYADHSAEGNGGLVADLFSATPRTRCCGVLRRAGYGACAWPFSRHAMPFS